MRTVHSDPAQTRRRAGARRRGFAHLTAHHGYDVAGGAMSRLHEDRALL